MKTNVSGTSLAAYRQLAAQDILSAQEAEIVAFLRRHARRDFTRNEIAEATGLRVASVCGRCHTLVRRGDILEGDRRACRITGFSGHALQIAPHLAGGRRRRATRSLQ